MHKKQLLARVFVAGKDWKSILKWAVGINYFLYIPEKCKDNSKLNKMVTYWGGKNRMDEQS